MSLRKWTLFRNDSDTKSAAWIGVDMSSGTLDWDQRSTDACCKLSVLMIKIVFASTEDVPKAELHRANIQEMKRVYMTRWAEQKHHTLMMVLYLKLVPHKQCLGIGQIGYYNGPLCLNRDPTMSKDNCANENESRTDPWGNMNSSKHGTIE